MTQPITDITSAVKVLNERKWRGRDRWQVDVDGDIIGWKQDQLKINLIYADCEAIAIANSLLLAERCAELETLLAECEGKPHSSKFNELSHKDQIEMLRAVIRVQPPSAAADCEPPHET